jgi:pyrroloquinoline-quinone synthase
MERWLVEIDETIAANHLLKHPFYQSWTDGTLPMEALQDYAGQYYKHELSFPTYLAGIFVNCGEDTQSRRALLENLIDEDRGEENHSELWLRFAESLGLERTEVASAVPNSCTSQTLEAFRQLCIEGTAVEGVAAINAYEEMIPEVAEAKIEGLIQHFGIDDERGLAFFALHRSLDVKHREWNRALLKALVKTEADRKQAVAASEIAVKALWTLLDGVQPASC